MHMRAFLPATEKVRQVELHPVQPWMATATKDEHVCVWDWRSQHVGIDMGLENFSKIRCEQISAFSVKADEKLLALCTMGMNLLPRLSKMHGASRTFHHARSRHPCCFTPRWLP